MRVLGQPLFRREPPSLRAVSALRLVGFHEAVDRPSNDQPEDRTVELRFSSIDPVTLQTLVDHRDIDLSVQQAYEIRQLKWGTANWGGLRIELVAEGDCIFTAIVDVYCIDDLDPSAAEIRLYAAVEPHSRLGGRAGEVVWSGRTDADETGDEGSTLRTRPGVSSGEDAVTSLRCPICGASMDLPAMMTMLPSTSESFATIPCPSGGHSPMIRVLPAHEAERLGYRFESVDPERLLRSLDPESLDQIKEWRRANGLE